MLRRTFQPCMTYAAGPRPGRDLEARPGHLVARPLATAAWIALAPFAALGAALAGLVFVVLLPVCGIASIAEAIARSCWGAVRAALWGGGRGAMSQH